MKAFAGRVTDLPSQKDVEHFVGEVWVDEMLEGISGVMSYDVFFTPGARTNWHSHTEGQLLYVTGGSGRVVSRNGESLRVRAGDIVWTEPDEHHWHGADPDSYMNHTAVSLGEAVWFDPVNDAEYAAIDAAEVRR